MEGVVFLGLAFDYFCADPALVFVGVPASGTHVVQHVFFFFFSFPFGGGGGLVWVLKLYRIGRRRRSVC